MGFKVWRERWDFLFLNGEEACVAVRACNKDLSQDATMAASQQLREATAAFPTVVGTGSAVAAQQPSTTGASRRKDHIIRSAPMTPQARG